MTGKNKENNLGIRYWVPGPGYRVPGGKYYSIRDQSGDLLLVYQ